MLRRSGSRYARVLYFNINSASLAAQAAHVDLTGPKMANIDEGGMTPALPPARLEEIGFKIAAYR